MSAPGISTVVPASEGRLRVLLVGSYSRDLLEYMAAQQEFAVDTILDGLEAIAAAAQLRFDIVVTGLRIDPADGMEVLRAFRAVDPDAPVIMSTHDTRPRTVVEVMQAGAFDYVLEPYGGLETFCEVLRRAAARRRTLLAARQLSRQLHDQRDLPLIVGRSKATQKLRQAARRAAAAESPVLITGESGTGKGLLARAIHEAGPRSRGPFVTVNCGAIPEQLIESELFGHVRGAFTGAVADRRGRVQQAGGGTIFLDEIAELSPNAQVKLLRFIEEQTFERVGESSARKADVRIICATNRNLPGRIAGGLFREDLFYRINVLSLHVSPLRQRPDDIPFLAQHFLEQMAADSGKDVRAISAEAMDILAAQDWPGNARELRNSLERAFVFSSGDTILRKDIPEGLSAGPGQDARGCRDVSELGLRKHLRREERRLIVQALESNDWVRSRAARDLRIPRSTLIRRMNVLGITTYRP